MKYIFLMIAVFAKLNLFAQVIVVDEKGKSIPYVDILLLHQNAFLWQTDINGKIPLSLLAAIDKEDTLILHHISFVDKKILKSDLENLDSIYLESNPYNFDEIRISGKRPKFQKITACYRNIKIQNGQPVFYTDGRANYYSKSKNLKYQLSKLEYRSFDNKDLSKFFNSYSVGIPMGYAYIPIPEEGYLPSNLIRKNKLILKRKDSISIKLLTKDSVLIGEILNKGNRIEFSINDISQIKKRKALNTEVDITAAHIFMIFRNDDLFENIQTMDNFDNLLYQKTLYKHSLQHDKEKQKRNIETIEEIFIEDIDFLNTVDEEYSNVRGMPKESNYNTEYWKDCDCELYYPPNNEIFKVMKMR